MTLVTNRVKVLRHFYGLTTETNNFASDVKVILGLESIRIYGLVAKIGLNGPNG